MRLLYKVKFVSCVRFARKTRLLMALPPKSKLVRFTAPSNPDRSVMFLWEAERLVSANRSRLVSAPAGFTSTERITDSNFGSPKLTTWAVIATTVSCNVTVVPRPAPFVAVKVMFAVPV